MAVLIEETLSKMNYAWELIVHKNTVHKLKIQITNNRIISLDIREKDFVQYIQKIPEFVDKLICLEKTYNMEIAIQSFIPNNNKALSNTYKLII